MWGLAGWLGGQGVIAAGNKELQYKKWQVGMGGGRFVTCQGSVGRLRGAS